MTAHIICWPIMKDIPKSLLKGGTAVISTVAKTNEPWCQLSPFILGPCKLYERNDILLTAKNMENAWQYSKVYAAHARDMTGKVVDPYPDYWKWAREGWRNPSAVRYPMGKGAEPLYSLWDGERLSYVEARKKIYAPLYAEAVQKTHAFCRLRNIVGMSDVVILKDYDAYDHAAEGMTLTDVLNNPDKKMGHAFVLAMLLKNDDALGECDLR